MTSVLFVCTGNIFRSLTAEYALRAALDGSKLVSVSSAGTNHSPNAKVREDVAAYLALKSLDVSSHKRRTLTQDMLQKTEHVISMSTDHQSILRDKHKLDSMLFTEACGGLAEPLLDLDDLFKKEDRHGLAAQKHIYKIIDQIIELTPKLAERLVSGRYGS